MPMAPKRLGGTKPKNDAYRKQAHERGYDYRWSKVAALAKKRDRGLCKPCERAGRTTLMALVDHIVPVHVRPDWRLNLDNTESQCRECHREKTDRDNATYGSREAGLLTIYQVSNRSQAAAMEHPPVRGRRRVVVYGPPCAGKTTYVQNHFQSGDMVWDYDAIASSIASTPMHDAPAWVISTVEQMRDAFIKAAESCDGTVWVIACMPALAKWCAEQMGAELMRLDPSPDLCMTRATASGRNRTTAIAEWYRQDAEQRANRERANG